MKLDQLTPINGGPCRYLMEAPQQLPTVYVQFSDIHARTEAVGEAALQR